MAREWISFDVHPGGENTIESGVIAFHNKIKLWLKENSTKSTKVKLIFMNTAVIENQMVDLYGHIQVKFRSSRDAVIFKMFFNDYIFDSKSLKNILIRTVRQVMPTVIANQIIGAPTRTILSGFSIKPSYTRKYTNIASPRAQR